MQYTYAQEFNVQLMKANDELRQQADDLEDLNKIRDIQAAENLFFQARREYDFTLKEDLYNQAINLLKRHDVKVDQAGCLRQLSTDYQQVWNYEKAVPALEEAIALYESAPDEFKGDDLDRFALPVANEQLLAIWAEPNLINRFADFDFIGETAIDLIYVNAALLH